MYSIPSRLHVFLAALCLLLGHAHAQTFQIVPTQVNAVVAPGFDHTDLRVPITGTAGGFDFGTLKATSSAGWVVPSIDAVTHEVVLVLHTSGLLNTSSATITVTAGGTTDTFTVSAAIAPLNIVKLVDDPLRSRVYGVQQDGLNAGAVVAIDPLSNTNLACVTVGKKPTDLAVSADGSEIIAINSVDQTITSIDAATMHVKETMVLPTYVNWGASDTTADVAYGRGNIIYYSDGSWAPVLYVFDRSTKKVLQQLTDNASNPFGFGDFAISPDGNTLYGWAQYGWSAGSANTYIMKYAVGADGRLTFVQRTTSPSYLTFGRDPLNTPLLIDGNGAHVFVKELAVNPGNIAQTQMTFPSEVYAISPGGEVAVTSTGIYDVATNLNLYTLPTTTTVEVITSDYARLVYFNPATHTIGTIDLNAAIGPKVLGRNLTPADHAIVFAPAQLQWSALPGTDTYQIYLGTTEADVQNATPASPSFLGQVSTPSLALSAPLPSAKYFWRIDSVNAAGTTKGEVFDFSVSGIACDVTSVNAATVQGHDSFTVDMHLTSAAPGLAYTAVADVPWITFPGDPKQTPATLTISLNAAAIAAGTYSANVTITPDGQPSFVLPVTFLVDPLAITVIKSDKTSANVYALSEAAAVNGAATRAYLLELDSSTKKVKRVVRAGSSATDLAVHNGDGRLYVANWKVGALLAIDKTTFQQVRAYGFTPFTSVGYGEGDVYRIAAGAPGRLLVEPEDQWIDIEIFDTVAGQSLKTIDERQGGGDYAPGGRYYYHGDDDDSGAEIHKFDVTGDAFLETAHTRVQSYDYYGSRTVVVSEDGAHVFWNGGMLDANLAVQWLIGDEIYSTSPDGRYAFGAAKVYDTTLKQMVFAMPVSTAVSAFNSTTNRLVVQNGPGISFYDIADLHLPAPVLTAGTIGTTTVGLSWTNPLSATSFTLQDRLSGQSDWTTVSSTLSGSTLSYTVGSLLAGQAYDFRITAGSSVSNIVSATTKAIVYPLPTAVTAAATAVTATAATFTGNVNPNGPAATVYFEYGSSSQYGNVTPSTNLAAGTTTKTVTASSGLLASATMYHYRVVAMTSAGTTYGADISFTTKGAASVLTLTDPTVGDTTATLSGVVNANGSPTTVQCEYGLTTDLGLKTATTIVNAPAQVVSFPIAQLAPLTTYYYRLVGLNASGSSASEVSFFTTLAEPLPAVTVFAGNDIAFTTRGHSQVVRVLDNDTAQPAVPLMVLSVANPFHGAAHLNPDGTVTYVPSSTFTGADAFNYVVGDGVGHNAMGTVLIQDTGDSAAGLYSGLVGSDVTDFQHSGSIQVQVSRLGSLTAKLVFGGVAHAIKTTLDFDGTATASIRLPAKKSLLVAFQFAPELQQVTGTVSLIGGDSTDVVAFSADRTDFDAQNPAPQVGRYSLLLPPDATKSAAQGYGFATMNVTAKGLVQISGRTPMAMPFASASYTSARQRFPLYAVLRSPRSTGLHGWVQFRPVEATSDLDGSLGWNSAANGATNPVALIGSRYTVPERGAMVLPYIAGAGNAQFRFGRADETPMTFPIAATLRPTSLVPASLQVFGVRLNLTTGLLSGFYSMHNRSTAFYGIVFQKQRMGAGVLTGGTTPGWMRLDSVFAVLSGDPVVISGGFPIIGVSPVFNTGSAGGNPAP